MTTVLIGFVLLVLSVLLYYGIIKLVSIILKISTETTMYTLAIAMIVFWSVLLISYGIGKIALNVIN